MQPVRAASRSQQPRAGQAPREEEGQRRRLRRLKEEAGQSLLKDSAEMETLLQLPVLLQGGVHQMACQEEVGLVVHRTAYPEAVGQGVRQNQKEVHQKGVRRQRRERMMARLQEGRAWEGEGRNPCCQDGEAGEACPLDPPVGRRGRASSSCEAGAA